MIEYSDENKNAYCAGLIDGEGSIQIKKSKGYHGEINPSYCLLLSVGNRYLSMCEWLKVNFGGSITTYNHRDIPMYKWQIASNQAANFLSRIQPYIVCKTPQIAVALRFHSIPPTKYCKGGTPLDKQSEREDCWRELKRLHKPWRVIFR